MKRILIPLLLMFSILQSLIIGLREYPLAELKMFYIGLLVTLAIGSTSTYLVLKHDAKIK